MLTEQPPVLADNNPTGAAKVEVPQLGEVGPARYGSDAIAEALAALEVPYIALNPGASYRGLHDSLVNYMGNSAPQMLLCLHEEHAIAIAQGYAKVTDKMMIAAVHSNVGLMHGTMAFFDAWCDRMPVLVLGATGPVDAAKRRPWIDWIHTARDQGALVRQYVKFDDQPASPEAAREAILRSAWIAQTYPRGPVYVNFDAEMQEEPLKEQLPPIDPKRYMPKVRQAAPADLVAEAAEMLKSAKNPVILAGRVSRSVECWNQRVRLAEILKARVGTDLKIGASFPTDHPLHCGPPSIFPAPGLQAALKEADVVLSIDWLDVGGTFRTTLGGEQPKCKIIQASLDHVIHNGWSMDHQGHPPVDLLLAADPDVVVAQLLEALGAGGEAPAPNYERKAEDFSKVEIDPDQISVDMMTQALREAVGDTEVCLSHVSLSWSGGLWHFRHPLDYIGGEGGGGIGGGPGVAVGAALALKGSGRLPIAVCGDGDFLMGNTALWTATHYRIPGLYVICNNRSFFNDEVHQERVARMRNRPVENKWIGQRIADPEPDMATMARSMGAVGYGPVSDPAKLVEAFKTAIADAKAGKTVLIDVHVKTGYNPNMTSGLTRAK